MRGERADVQKELAAIRAEQAVLQESVAKLLEEMVAMRAEQAAMHGHLLRVLGAGSGGTLPL